MLRGLIGLATTLLGVLAERWMIDLAAELILWWRTQASEELKIKCEVKFQQLQADWDNIRKD